VLKTNNVSGQAVTNSVTPITRPGRETAIGQPGTTAIGEPGIAAIGQAGTIIGVGLGMTNRGRLPNSTNETAAPQLGQAGRETAIGERGAAAIGEPGIAAIGRAGTIIGVGVGMTNRGRLPTSSNETAAPQLGQPGRETALGKPGATAIGEQGITSISRQGTIIGVGLGLTNRVAVPTSTNSVAKLGLGQPGRETAIGLQGTTAIGDQQGIAGIGRAGTIIGNGLGMTNRGVVPSSTNAAPSLGQPGRETAIGQQGTTAIGQQGSTAIGEQSNAGIMGRQGTIIGFGVK